MDCVAILNFVFQVWKMFSIVPRIKQSEREKEFSSSVCQEKVPLLHASPGSKMGHWSDEEDRLRYVCTYLQKEPQTDGI